MSEQIASIQYIASGRPVILVEDGAFSGGTLRCIAEKFEKSGILLSSVIIGFGLPNALKSLSSIFDGKLILTEEIDGEPVEWMPDHDFFPFVPNCGRVLGSRFGADGEVLPFYDHLGFSYSIPYVFPFCDITRWASIPEEKAREFSLFCLHQDIRLFEIISKMNRCRIKVKQLVSPRLKVSVPISAGQKSLPVNDYVISFLHDICHELS